MRKQEINIEARKSTVRQESLLLGKKNQELDKKIKI